MTRSVARSLCDSWASCIGICWHHCLQWDNTVYSWKISKVNGHEVNTSLLAYICVSFDLITQERKILESVNRHKLYYGHYLEDSEVKGQVYKASQSLNTITWTAKQSPKVGENNITHVKCHMSTTWTLTNYNVSRCQHIFNDNAVTDSLWIMLTSYNTTEWLTMEAKRSEVNFKGSQYIGVISELQEGGTYRVGRRERIFFLLCLQRQQLERFLLLRGNDTAFYRQEFHSVWWLYSWS